MYLIERYVGEVSRLLPEELRSDVACELSSLLADALDERCRGGASGCEADAATALLLEMGPPHELAASYLAAFGESRRSSFGSWPVQWRMLTAGLLAALGALPAFDPHWLLGPWLRAGAVGRLCSAIATASLLLIVGIVLGGGMGDPLGRRTRPPRSWHPRDLLGSRAFRPAAVTASRIPLVATLVALIVLSSTVDTTTTPLGAGSGPMTIAGAMLAPMLPWAGVGIALELTLGAALLLRDRWTVTLATLATAVSVGWLAILWAFHAGLLPPVDSIGSAPTAPAGLTRPSVPPLDGPASWIVLAVFAVAAVVCCTRVAKVVQLVRERRQIPRHASPHRLWVVPSG